MISKFINEFRIKLSHIFNIISIQYQSVLDVRFSGKDISALFEISKDDTKSAYIDDQTWNDLDINYYMEILSKEISILGQQQLYSILKYGSGTIYLSESIKTYKKILKTPEKIIELSNIFTPLRGACIEICTELFNFKKINENYLFRYAFLLQIFLFVLIVFFIKTPIGLPFLFFVLISTIFFQIILESRIDKFESFSNEIVRFLNVGKKLVELKNTPLDVFVHESEFHGDLINKLLSSFRKFSFSIFFPAIGKYLDWYLCVNIRNYYLKASEIEKNIKALQEYYCFVSRKEAEIAIIKHLSMRDDICWANIVNNNEFELVSVINPLLSNPCPISISAHKKGIFLSGQNGSGKSTMLRTIGINLILGRSFGFCYAQSATVSTSLISSSIRIEDSIESGDSLYMAELRRIAFLLDISEKENIIILIDEIFRGTNNMESVSASAAVIKALSTHALVIVSSHNLILANLLSLHLDSMTIAIENGRQKTLTKGVLTNTNGISMMNNMGISYEIQKEAEEIYQWLTIQ